MLVAGASVSPSSEQARLLMVSKGVGAGKHGNEESIAPGILFAIAKGEYSTGAKRRYSVLSWHRTHHGTVEKRTVSEIKEQSV